MTSWGAWLAGAAAMTAVGTGVQRLREARDRRNHPAPGRTIELGDASVHVVVEGAGPVVLIDSGLGGSSIEWGQVAADLSRDFTVIRYDRPGFAWSPESHCDRRARAAASRIIEILDELAPSAPAILVGHSLGGIHVRLAAALAPTRVAGLVLVDPSHEDMLSVAESSKAAAMSRTVMRVVAALAPFGFGRIAGRGFGRLALADLRQPLHPDAAHGVHVSGLLTSRTVHGLRALAAEHTALEESLRQVGEVTKHHPEPDVPLTVISAAAPSATARIAQARSDIGKLHVDLVSTREFARQVLAERSGHLVPLDQPEIITRCVRETAAAVARGSWEPELTP